MFSAQTYSTHQSEFTIKSEHTSLSGFLFHLITPAGKSTFLSTPRESFKHSLNLIFANENQHLQLASRTAVNISKLNYFIVRHKSVQSKWHITLGNKMCTHWGHCCEDSVSPFRPHPKRRKC